jgi:hypothetical protein
VASCGSRSSAMVWRCRDHARMSNDGACWCDHTDVHPLLITLPGRLDPDRDKRAPNAERQRMRARTSRSGMSLSPPTPKNDPRGKEY